MDTNLGQPEPYHPLTNHRGNPVRKPQAGDIDVYHAQLFAEFVGKMQETIEIDGSSLLDNSILVYGAGLGNGDIHTADDALRMFDETGCDAVMVARGVLGSPWIFRQIGELLSGGTAIQVNPVLIADTCREHFELLRRYYSERMTVNLSKKHLNWYLKVFPGAAQWRRLFMACDTSAQVDQVVTDFHNFAHTNGEAIIADREPDQVINVN